MVNVRQEPTRAISDHDARRALFSLEISLGSHIPSLFHFPVIRSEDHSRLLPTKTGQRGRLLFSSCRAGPYPGLKYQQECDLGGLEKMGFQKGVSWRGHCMCCFDTNQGPATNHPRGDRGPFARRPLRSPASWSRIGSRNGPDLPKQVRRS